MHYTSWDRTDRESPVLLVEAGPEKLGVFSRESAEVEGKPWRLDSAAGDGPTAWLSADRFYRLTGRPGKGSRFAVTLDTRAFAFIMEGSGNWIIEDDAGEKVGQFTSKNSGVRRAIVEFEGDAPELSREEIAGLSWFARLILEANTKNMATPVIGTLVLLSIVAVLALFVL